MVSIRRPLGHGPSMLPLRLYAVFDRKKTCPQPKKPVVVINYLICMHLESLFSSRVNREIVNTEEDIGTVVRTFLKSHHN